MENVDTLDLETSEEKIDLAAAKKLINLEQSAKARNLDFNLNFATVKKLIQTKKCFYTGIAFEKAGPHSRTIDRIDTAKGYIKGNVVAATVEFNGKKANLTLEDIRILFHKTKNLQIPNSPIKK